MKILLFDIDGTLLLTGGAGRIAFERIFKELFNKSNAWQDLTPDGKTDPLIISELAQKNLSRDLTAEEYQEVYDRYDQYFDEELAKGENFQVMPGIPDLIKQLAGRQDCLVGIATGNFEHAGWKKLSHAGLRPYFQFGGFGSDSAERLILTKMALERGCALSKIPIDLADVYVIGDTIHDIAAGKGIGAKTIGVATGKTTPETLKQAHPEAVFEDFSDPEPFLSLLV